ncbi:MAG: rod shape-determining protein MreD [Actinobacteria bacterium]|nr:rod shape-determining protein MreD [Actinomycetota bacterium]
MKIFLKFVHLVFILICLIIQMSFIEHLKIFYINIDLIMVAVIGIAAFDGTVYGLISGFIAGLILDLMTARIIGINALIYSVNGFIAGKVMESGFKKRILAYVLMIFFFSEANLLLQTGIYYIFNYSSSFTKLGIEMLLYPVCNIAVMFLIFPLLKAGTERSGEIGFIFKDEA